LLQTVNKVEIFSGFCYTQLTDTFQEANGLLYADRTPKFPIEAIASATLGRGTTEDEETMLLESVKVALSQVEDVFSDAIKARRSQTYAIQPTPHCGGDHGS
ncbi:MAG TPA: glycoside hydrolase family 2, partial [Leptolyngbyaceae cyanobacterium M33_DOE_097]|nr:glycoside hydrolase family 2 [Leptolyngbyaceae cyanobacterium M33_DOE_097]